MLIVNRVCACVRYKILSWARDSVIMTGSGLDDGIYCRLLLQSFITAYNQSVTSSTNDDWILTSLPRINDVSSTDECDCFNQLRVLLLYLGANRIEITTLNSSHYSVFIRCPFRLTTSNFIFQVNTCGHSPCVTSSLMRGRVCRLQLLLVLVSAIILRSESRGTHDHILLSQIRYSTNLEARSPYLYRRRTEWPGYTPRHWFPFSSSPMTRRATVEIFDPASTRETSDSESQLLYDWRFTANQFVLATSPLSLRISNFFATEHLRS
jgi:hypothetical protein